MPMRTDNLAIAFVDIAGFTSRTSSQSREENERMLQRFAHVVRPLVRAFGGRVVKSIGDAFLLTFRSPTDALHCAMAIQDGLAESNQSLPTADRIAVRVAVNVGEVRVDGGDVFGEAVNIASRIESVAGAGEIYFSEAVYLAMTKSEVPSERVGERSLKGIPEPVGLWRIPHSQEVGGYRVTGNGPAVATDTSHPLEPPALPFGGLSLNRVRDQLEAGTFAPARLVPAAVQLLQHTHGLKSRLITLGSKLVGVVRSSRRARLAIVALLVIVVGVSSYFILRPKPKPVSRWQRLQHKLGID